MTTIPDDLTTLPTFRELGERSGHYRVELPAKNGRPATTLVYKQYIITEGYFRGKLAVCLVKSSPHYSSKV